MTIDSWIKHFEAKAAEIYPNTDPSHDLLHVKRVVAMARQLAAAEGADENIVIPAAYFHDFVSVPKNDPRRKEASKLSATAATEWLASIDYPGEFLPGIAHAIAAHSFSAAIPCETLEAKVVQDADRLDAIGAIGIARTFTVSGILGRAYYDAADVKAEQRAPDDQRYALDHFKVKLFGLVETMHTPAARAEGARRLEWMRDFYDRFADEVTAVGA